MTVEGNVSCLWSQLKPVLSTYSLSFSTCTSSSAEMAVVLVSSYQLMSLICFGLAIINCPENDQSLDDEQLAKTGGCGRPG